MCPAGQVTVPAPVSMLKSSNKREARAYLAIHKTLKSGGTSIDPPDALIGATAVANNWTLATRNTKHLARTGARVESPREERSA
ncbi:hypothetical protein Aple_073140 [Acrocarpospora pleiomorpha]|uniref:PIN domain-containing protein n=2 Tax=Acrocarpospora pleiomorpha TaxID=90975 RepID=A0A5M3XT60_9ACTN|nr:hypothetical protein Aple_073140 [Acrocarpospora pleiomorpha]